MNCEFCENLATRKIRTDNGSVLNVCQSCFEWYEDEILHNSIMSEIEGYYEQS